MIYKLELTSTSVREIIEALELQAKHRGGNPFALDVIENIKKQTGIKEE